MNGIKLWEYLERHKEDIKNDLMIVDCWEAQDVDSCCETEDGDCETPESEIKALIAFINNNIDAEQGVTWDVILTTYQNLKREGRL